MTFQTSATIETSLPVWDMSQTKQFRVALCRRDECGQTEPPTPSGPAPTHMYVLTYFDLPNIKIYFKNYILINIQDRLLWLNVDRVTSREDQIRNVHLTSKMCWNKFKKHFSLMRISCFIGKLFCNINKTKTNKSSSINPSCFQEVKPAETGSETVFAICQPVVGLKKESQQEVIKAVERRLFTAFISLNLFETWKQRLLSNQQQYVQLCVCSARFWRLSLFRNFPADFCFGFTGKKKQQKFGC